MSSFKLSILSPAGKAFDGDAESVTVAGSDGNLSVLAHHAPMIAALRPGLCTVTQDKALRLFYAGEGVVEVSRTEVVVLVDEAIKVETADEAKNLARQRIEKAAAQK